MNNTNAQEYRSALKKAISAANQALELHYALEGVGAQNYDSAPDLINNLFAKRMNILEVDFSVQQQPQSRSSGISEGNFGTYAIASEDYDSCLPIANDRYRNFFITQDGVLFLYSILE